MSKKLSRKSKKTKTKLKTFYVPVTVTISGLEEVKAKSPKEAIEKAKKQYYKKDTSQYGHGVESRCIWTDFAEYEDEVETDDE